MENMPTVQYDTRLLAKTCCVTNCAIIVDCLIVKKLKLFVISDLIIVHFNALGLQTGQTLRFTSESMAHMATSVYFCAAFGNHLNTSLITAAILKSRIICRVRSLYFSCTESALTRILVALRFLARHAYVVGLPFALSTKILLTITAPDSALGHMLSRLA